MKILIIANSRYNHSDLLEKFNSKTTKSDGCWTWDGYTSSTGYGAIWLNGKNFYAHRLSYLLFKGEIPPKYDIDHLCRNILCVNPEHLQAVTHRDNVLRGISIVSQCYRKTHCVRGHLLSGENMRINCDGARECITCARYRWKKWKKNKNNENINYC